MTPVVNLTTTSSKGTIPQCLEWLFKTILFQQQNYGIILVLFFWPSLKHSLLESKYLDVEEVLKCFLKWARGV